MTDNTYFQAEGPKAKLNWVKQLYYYIILAGSILALSIAAFSFLRANLVRFVFTELEYDSYSYYGVKSQCYNDLRAEGLRGKNITGYTPDGNPILATSQTSVDKSESTEKETVKEPTTEEIDKCAETLKLRKYQDVMLGSILTLVIAGAVLGIHVKFFKIEK